MGTPARLSFALNHSGRSAQATMFCRGQLSADLRTNVVPIEKLILAYRETAVQNLAALQSVDRTSTDTSLNRFEKG